MDDVFRVVHDKDVEFNFVLLFICKDALNDPVQAVGLAGVGEFV